MTRKRLRFGIGFSVVLKNKYAQAATMVLRPGDSEGGPANRHRGCDQWLYVVSGSGMAKIGGKRQTLQAGTLLLIQRGTTHEIKNTGRTPLQTLNVYVPPAYTSQGDPLPRAK
jgi:mannose-6-phosphate isomerase-like protein (cupin superfamily)